MAPSGSQLRRQLRKFVRDVGWSRNTNLRARWHRQLALEMIEALGELKSGARVPAHFRRQVAAILDHADRYRPRAVRNRRAERAAREEREDRRLAELGSEGYARRRAREEREDRTYARDPDSD